MKLYFSPGTCSLAPHILFREAGLPYTLERVDLRAKTYAEGKDYRQINPKGAVPTIEMGPGEVLTEGVAILQWIAGQKPESKLMPKPGTLESAHAQEWLNFVTSEIHKTFSMLFGAGRLVKNAEGMEQLKDSARELLSQKLHYITSQLGQKSYLLGETFTAPDSYLFTCLRWSKSQGLDLAKWPVVQKYMDRIAARPKVQEAMHAEGLT